MLSVIGVTLKMSLVCCCMQFNQVIKKKEKKEGKQKASLVD